MTKRTKSDAKEKQIAELERRYIAKIKSLLPGVVHQFLGVYFGQMIKARDAFRNSRPVLKMFERELARVQQHLRMELFASEPALTAEERARINEILEAEIPVKAVSSVTPEVEKLRKGFLRELGRINPRLIRSPDCSPAEDELKALRRSVNWAVCNALVEKGISGSIRRHFKKRALQLLPLRLHPKFEDACNHLCLDCYLKPFRPYINDAEYEFVTERALSLAGVEFVDGPRQMEEPRLLRRARRLAYERQDWRFFARLHDKCKRKRRTTIEAFFSIKRLPKLDTFLFQHWVDPLDGVPALFRLSIQELCNVCKKHLENERLTEGAVDKTSRRLGLMTLRKGVLTRPVSAED